MNFKISKNKFYNALQIVSRAISPNSPVPSLCGVLIEAGNDGITLTGSDGDISIRMHLSNTIDENLNLSVLEEGSVVIDSRYITAIASKMNSNDIQVEIIDGTLTRFSSLKTEYKINGYRASDYPSIDFNTPATNFTIKSSDLTEIIESTAFATSVKETRPVLTGVNFQSNGTEIVATATDSYRLAKKTYPLTAEVFNVTIPAKSLNEAKSIFNSENDDIQISLDTKKVQFSNGSILMQSRLLEGGFPETERLIPKEFAYKLVINRQDLISAIDRNMFIKNEKMTLNRLQINNKDDISLTNKSQEIGESIETMNAISYEGEPIDISFAGNYVMDAAKALDTVNIKIQFTGSMKPFVLTNDSEDSSVLQLVLPVKTYN